MGDMIAFKVNLLKTFPQIIALQPIPNYDRTTDHSHPIDKNFHPLPTDAGFGSRFFISLPTSKYLTVVFQLRFLVK